MISCLRVFSLKSYHNTSIEMDKVKAKLEALKKERDEAMDKLEQKEGEKKEAIQRCESVSDSSVEFPE